MHSTKVILGFDYITFASRVFPGFVFFILLVLSYI